MFKRFKYNIFEIIFDDVSNLGPLNPGSKEGIRMLRW